MPGFYRLNYEGINKLHMRQAAFKKLIDDRFAELDITALLTPCQYHCAFKNEDAMELHTTHDYYLLANLIHYPGGVVPAGEVRKGEYGDYLENSSYKDKVAHSIANSEMGSDGMPIGLQVMAQ
jgi:Asp-tRNA(Asn)/Glu-tRNA(Gln) amidotransferase A subunit family amidase